MLKVKHLDAWYGQVQVLHDVHLYVKAGEIVSVIGPNGAGKSTALKAIVNLVRRKGTLLFEGKSLLRVRPEGIVRKGICFVPQGRVVFPSLTVIENLEMGAFIRADDYGAELRYVFEKFPILKKRKQQRAGLMSGGEQQMLALGRALMLRPKMLMLDEPSIGLSPKLKVEIFEKIREVAKDQGIAVLMVEQNARMALKLSDRAYVLELGRNKLEGKNLLKDKRVERLYLGGVV